MDQHYMIPRKLFCSVEKSPPVLLQLSDYTRNDVVSILSYFNLLHVAYTLLWCLTLNLVEKRRHCGSQKRTRNP